MRPPLWLLISATRKELVSKTACLWKPPGNNKQQSMVRYYMISIVYPGSIFLCISLGCRWTGRRQAAPPTPPPVLLGWKKTRWVSTKVSQWCAEVSVYLAHYKYNNNNNYSIDECNFW